MVLCPDLVNHDVAGGVTGATQIDGSEFIAVVECDDGLIRLGVEVCEQLKFDDSARIGEFPAPDVLTTRHEFSVPQGFFEAASFDGPTRDFEVDLDVDIGGSGVSPI